MSLLTLLLQLITARRDPWLLFLEESFWVFENKGSSFKFDGSTYGMVWYLSAVGVMIHDGVNHTAKKNTYVISEAE